MFNQQKKDYDNLKKILSAKEYANVSQDPVIKSLDDVFFVFEKLVNKNSSYNINIKTYLNKNVNSLNNALESGNSFVVDEICLKTSNFFIPKHYSLLKKKRDGFGFYYAFKSLIEQYEFNKIVS